MMKKNKNIATISAVGRYLPKKRLTNHDLEKIVDSIFKKGEKTLLLTIINKNNRRRYLGVKIN